MLQKNKLTEGPLLHAFGNSFLVVKGTGNHNAQQSYVDTIVNSFSDTWFKSYDVSPRIKKDIEIDSLDIASHNLILIGNQHTNKIFKSIYNQLPLKVEKDYLELDGKVFNGNALGYYMIYPNPLNLKKYVVLIGGNDLSKIDLGKRKLAEDGFYDYELFNYSYNTPKKINKGYFNEYWKL